MAGQHDVHPNQITEWNKQLHENSDTVFGTKPPENAEVKLKELQAKIIQLTIDHGE